MMKRKSISKRVQRMLLGFTLVALVISSIIAMMGMGIIRSRVIEDSEWLGASASSVAAQALTEQMEQNRKNVADSRAEYAGAQLNRISGYVESLSSSLEYLYQHKSQYNPVPVLPPDKKNQGKYVLMRDFADESIKLADIQEEMELLGNIEPMCSSVIAVGKQEIATIFLGTESGVLISYDPSSQLADPGPGKESYYNYFASNWYEPAKNKDGVMFTDTYLDNYGRGLTITCAMPFHNEKGEVAGVVGMDILVSDMLNSIIALESNDGSYVILVDKEGDVIASPYMDKNSEELSNIRTDTSQPIFEVANQILDGRNGITRTAANIYYSYSEIGLTEWTLVICIPAESISDPVSQISNIIEEGTDATTGSISRTISITITLLVIVLIVITVAVTLLSGAFTKRIIQPLISLRDDVMRISGGDLSHRAEIVENDEIGDLATSFNNMSASLTEYIDNLTKVTAEKERIGAELNVATQIQADMLPRIFPPFPEKTEQFDIYATMNPAKEVGGDFYDFFLLDDNHIAMVMADVSGKGVPAALFMVIAKTLIKNRALMGGEPAEILKYVNNQLCEGNEAELFVTVWLGILNLTTGKGLEANAGHEHPAIKRSDGKFELIVNKHSPAVATMEGLKFRQNEFELNPGDVLYVYTDGVAEATNANNELYGTERMIDALNANADSTMEELLAGVKKSVDDFVGEAPQFDDITMLGFKRY